MQHVPVLIVGGGPVGLFLGLELNRHGVKALLVERNQSTTDYPKMDITNGRTAELFRRMGVIDKVRDIAVPTSHKMSVVWSVQLAKHLLTRFDYPSVDEQRDMIRNTNDGTQAREANLRLSQVLLEPLIKRELEDSEHIDVEFGWGLKDFTEDQDGVTATLLNDATGEERQIRCDHLAGCDGGGSRTRRILGINLDHLNVVELMNQAGGVMKNIMMIGKGLLRGEKPNDGRVYIIHFKSKDKELFEHFGLSWHTQFPDGSTLIAQDDVETWTLHFALKQGERAEDIDPKERLFKILGREVDCEILINSDWRPVLAVADSYGKERVWLCGDATHQFIPTGAYGMNTGVCDAVGLGWQLAAVVNGWAGPKMLEAYAFERRQIALRNRSASARHMSIRIKIAQSYTPKVYDDGPAGDRARKEFGALIHDLGNLENQAWGVEYGYRYKESPVICYDDATPPPDDWEKVHPGTYPGVRIPSLFLEDGSAIFDLLGKGFTLIRFTDTDVSGLVDAAKSRGVPLDILDIRDNHAHRIYERDLVLVRPDHHVAWRGNEQPLECGAVMDKIRGS